MTWPRIVATSSGKLRARLSIQGFQYEPVTSASMERTASDGRIRKMGLTLEGVVIPRRSNPIDVLPDVAATVFRIADIDGVWTEAFEKQPSYFSWLRTTLAAGGATVAVYDTTGSPGAGGRLHIDQETILIGSVDAGNDQFLGCTRAEWNTWDRTHYGENTEIRAVEVTDKPRTLMGRECRLYLYGDGDSVQGEGHLVWAGVVGAEPKLVDATMFELSVDNKARLLSQVLGEGLDAPMAPRGIYYHQGCLLRGEVTIRATGDHNDSSESYPFYVRGHFETQQEFCDEFTTQANAAISGEANAPTITAVPDGDEWRIEVTMAATARYASVGVESPVDGATLAFLWEAEGEDSVDVAVASQTYYMRWSGVGPPGVRMVPRGGFAAVESLADPGRRTGVTAADFPQTRKVFLDGGIAVSGFETVRIKWGDDNTEALYFVDAEDSTERSLVLRESFGATRVYQAHVYTPALMPSIRVTRVLVNGGTIADAIDAIIADGADESTRGGSPTLTTDDIDTTEFQAVISDLARGRPISSNRLIAIGAAVELGEIVKHELLIYGASLGFDETGRMSPWPIRVPVATDPAVVAVTMLRPPSAPWPTWQKNALGTLKAAVVRTGYQAYTDKHEGTTQIAQDVTVGSRNPIAASIEVKPLSVAHTPIAWDATTHRDVVAMMRPLLGWAGYPHAIVGFEASISAIDSVPGTLISFTTNALPNLETGKRGLANVEYAGMVLDNDVDLDRGRCMITAYVSLQGYVGYAPAAGFATADATDLGSNLWDLVVRGGDPEDVEAWALDTDNASDFWQAGDTVEAYTWNTGTPAAVTGTVTAVTNAAAAGGTYTGTIRVQFGGVYTPASLNVLRFQGAAAATSHMDDFAYFADVTRRIAFSSAIRARSFAP